MQCSNLSALTSLTTRAEKSVLQALYEKTTILNSTVGLKLSIMRQIMRTYTYILN